MFLVCRSCQSLQQAPDINTIRPGESSLRSIISGPTGATSSCLATSAATTAVATTATVTVTSVSYATTTLVNANSIVRVPTIGQLPLDCPRINGTTLSFNFVGSARRFALTCGPDGKSVKDICSCYETNYESSCST